MKSKTSHPSFHVVLAALALVVAVAGTTAALAQSSGHPKAAPRISGIRSVQTNLVVTVQVPSGVRRITLESRPRIGGGTWKPRAVINPTNDLAEVTMTIPVAEVSEVLRVVTDDALSLGVPSGFFQGSENVTPQLSPTQPVQSGAGGSLVGAGTVPGMAVADRNAVSTATIQESDIWKFSGDTLYFFNQQRGLQVIDVSRAASPEIRGTLPLVARGEQMYVLPGSSAPGAKPSEEWLALLTRPECRWDATEVILVHSTGRGPQAGSTLLLPGYPVESRLVGQVLVVASQGWTNRPVSPADPQGATVSESLTWLSAVDLSEPAKPILRSSVELTAMTQAIHAADRHLFLATTLDAGGAVDPSNPKEFLPPTYQVTVFDIADPAAGIRKAGSFKTAGRVADKFKFGLDGEVLTVVSQVDARWRAGGTWDPSVVTLETFSLQNPSKPERLARLNLVTNESVFATRYDGARAYVVTFRRVDPLWIVDLSDPKAPRIRGELEVPGWSTYIEPLGDRLIAMGVEQGRAAVSLFDVSDADAPRLADKVFLGDGWSWSEANADEKAFSVFAAEGLVLLPWHGQTGNKGWFQGVQLLEFTRDALKLRGTINHNSAARRAKFVSGHILSVSGGELVSADITDRDHPQVRSVLALSESVDQLFVSGDRLVQIANGSWDAALQAQTAPKIRLCPASDPDSAFASLTLTNLPVVGADLRDGLLYLLQRGPDTSRVENPGTANEVWTTIPGETLMQVVSIRGDRLEVLGRSSPSKVSASGWGRYTAHWPTPRSLVWAQEGGFAWPLWMRGGVMIAGDMMIAPGRGLWFGGSSSPWLAVDVTFSNRPVFVGEYPLGEGGSVSALSVRGGKVFASLARHEWVPATTNRTLVAPVLPWWETQGSWVTHHSLRVLDASDSAEPVLRDPVPLPGELQGVSHGGSVLYCRVESSDSKGVTGVSLQALGYDGLKARKISDRGLPDLGAHPVAVLGDGRIGVCAKRGTVLETWALDPVGILETVAPAVALGFTVDRFIPFEGGLLGEGDGSLVLVDSTQAPFRVVAVGDRPCSLWIDRSSMTPPTPSGIWVARGVSGAWWLPLRSP